MVSLVYMVAGLSSRFGGKIKQFAKVGPHGETFIECSINQALKNPFSKIIFIVGNMTEKPFKEKFGDNYKGIPVEYALQKFDPEKRDRPWGTADAVASVAGLIQGSCVLCNGDDMYGEKAYKIIFNHLKNSDEDAIVTLKLSSMLPEKGEVTRGIFNVKNNYLVDAKEFPNVSKFNYKEKGLSEESHVNLNLFGLQHKSIQKVKQRVEEFKGKHKGDRNIECFIHYILADMVKVGETKIKVYMSDGKWIGITNPEDEVFVREELRKNS